MRARIYYSPQKDIRNASSDEISNMGTDAKQLFFIVGRGFDETIREGTDLVRLCRERARRARDAAPPRMAVPEGEEDPEDSQEHVQGHSPGRSTLGAYERRSEVQRVVLRQGGQGPLSDWSVSEGARKPFRRPRLIRSCASWQDRGRAGCGVPNCSCTVSQVRRKDEGSLSSGGSQEGVGEGDEGSQATSMATEGVGETRDAATQTGDVGMGGGGGSGQELLRTLVAHDQGSLHLYGREARRHHPRVRREWNSEVVHPGPIKRPRRKSPVYRLGAPEERCNHLYQVLQRDSVLHPLQDTMSEQL